VFVYQLYVQCIGYQTFLHYKLQQPNDVHEKALTSAKGESQSQAKGEGQSMTQQVPTQQTVILKSGSESTCPYICQVLTHINLLS